MTALNCLWVRGVQCRSDLDRQAASPLVVRCTTWPLGLKLLPYIPGSSWMPHQTELASCLPIRPAFLRPTIILILMPGLLMTSNFARHLLRRLTSTPGPQFDVNLWQACFTSRGRQARIRCHIVQPIVTSQCPFRSGGPMVSSNATSFTPKHDSKQIRKKLQSSTVHLPVLHSFSCVFIV